MSDSGQDILGLQLVFHLQPSMGGAEDACSRVSGPDSPGQHFLGIFWSPTCPGALSCLDPWKA